MDISDCMDLCRANGFGSITEAVTVARLARAENERLATMLKEAHDKWEHCLVGFEQVKAERDALRAALKAIADGHEAPHWLAAKTIGDEPASGETT